MALACQDKWLCHEMLTARGLPSPETWLPDDADPAALPYPVLLKPRLGFAGRHIYRCSDARRAGLLPRATRPVESVVQRALPGREFSIDCLGDPDGQALGAVPRAMIQSKGGEQIKGETLDDPQLVEVAVATVEGLGPGGPQHGPVLPRQRHDPRHHRHQHPLRRRVPAAAGGGGRLRGDDPGHRRRPAPGVAGGRATGPGSS